MNSLPASSRWSFHFIQVVVYSIGMVVLFTERTDALAGACTVCVNGNDVSYVNQSKAFSIEGLPVQNCGELLQTAPLVQLDDPLCRTVRTFGTYCGCPRSENACTLCENGTASLLYPLRTVPNVNASDYVFGAPADVKLNCETLDAALNYQATTGDALCLKFQRDVGVKTCGCPNISKNYSNITTTTATINGTKNDGKNQSQVTKTPSQPSCTVCLDGTSPVFPNKTLQLGSLPIKNCRELESFSAFLRATDPQCGGLQSLGPYCGCPVPPGACTFCPNGEAVVHPDKRSYIANSFQGLPSGFIKQATGNLTCSQLESILAVPPPKSLGFGVDPALACYAAQFFSGDCGCSPGRKAKIIVWFFRTSAMLSLIGSSSIIRSVLTRSSSQWTTYYHLILSISCFDIVTALAYVLSDLLLPISSGAYHAHGNDATCKLQGFMIQLGETSLFYNLLLSVYFLLLVKYNWKEHRFQKYRNYIHVPILAIGITLAVVCIRYVIPQFGFCYVGVPPQYPNRIPITFLFAIPTCFALLIIVVCNAAICHHVYATETTTLPLPTKQNLVLTKKVVWQSILYCGVFIVTLPYLMINYYVNFKSERAIWQFAISALFAPSQGFLNCLIFFQSDYLLQMLKTVMCCCCCRQQLPEVEPARDEKSLEREETDSGQDHEASGATEEVDDEDHDADDVFSAAAEHWVMHENSRESIFALSVRTKKTSTTSMRNVVCGDESPSDPSSQSMPN